MTKDVKKVEKILEVMTARTLIIDDKDLSKSLSKCWKKLDVLKGEDTTRSRDELWMELLIFEGLVKLHNVPKPKPLHSKNVVKSKKIEEKEEKKRKRKLSFGIASLD
jgi:hypothetical protein